MNISGRGKKSRKYVYYEHCENAILQKVQSKCSQNRLLSENQCIFSRICMLIYASATEMESVVCDKTSKTTRKPRKCSIFGAFLACLTRFERATCRVGVCHSIQLSYRHICIKYSFFKDYRSIASESVTLSS